MKSILFILFIIVTPLVSYSYSWDPIGPDTIQVNDYLSSIFGDLLCTPDGIYLQSWSGEYENWELYPSSIPVLQAARYDTSGVLIILNNGSYSDGIYKFNGQSKNFELLEFCPRPNFIQQYQIYPGSKYFCGYEGGMMTSTDGKEWKQLEYFKAKTIFAMATIGSNCLVTDSSNVFFSSDSGKSWIIAGTAPPKTVNLLWTENSKAYLIYPGDSRSSGLWSSADSGKTWNVEFWSVEMSALFSVYNSFLVGWDRYYEDYGGVALWINKQKDLQFINDGLPKAGVNRITQNDLIDCINAVVCTDSGAYISCNFQPTSIQEAINQPAQFNLSQNYPNPFNNETVIAYQLDQAEFVDLSIYNPLGQKIITLISAKHAPGEYFIHWNSAGRASGIYFCQLKVGKSVQVRKMILLQ